MVAHRASRKATAPGSDARCLPSRSRLQGAETRVTSRPTPSAPSTLYSCLGYPGTPGGIARTSPSINRRIIAASDLGERAMRLSSSLIAPSAVAVLSTALLFSLTGAAMSQTQPPAGGTPLPGIVVGAPKQSASRPKRASHAVSHSAARISIASASDPPVYGRDTLATTTGNCSSTTFPVVSPVPCTKPYAHNYVECAELLAARTGARSFDTWWWCSNQGFKN